MQQLLQIRILNGLQEVLSETLREIRHSHSPGRKVVFHNGVLLWTNFNLAIKGNIVDHGKSGNSVPPDAMQWQEHNIIYVVAA